MLEVGVVQDRVVVVPVPIPGGPRPVLGQEARASGDGILLRFEGHRDDPGYGKQTPDQDHDQAGAGSEDRACLLHHPSPRARARSTRNTLMSRYASSSTLKKSSTDNAEPAPSSNCSITCR